MGSVCPLFRYSASYGSPASLPPGQKQVQVHKWALCGMARDGAKSAVDLLCYCVDADAEFLSPYLGTTQGVAEVEVA